MQQICLQIQIVLQTANLSRQLCKQAQPIAECQRPFIFRRFQHFAAGSFQGIAVISYILARVASPHANTVLHIVQLASDHD